MSVSTRIEQRREKLKSPRAAAIAGILFSILFMISMVLIRQSMPLDPTAVNDWTDTTRSQLELALRLMPFAGIAFLWFVGVIRDRLGDLEDRFFATVTLGSGLLFLGMVFIATAMGAGMLTAYQIGGRQMSAESYTINRMIIAQIFNTYGLKMAGVFMISIGTLWWRTDAMPHVFSYLTYLLALTMLLTTSLNLWMVLVFPVWVFVVSIYILILNFRRNISKVPVV